MRLAQQSLQHSHLLWSCAIDGLCLIQIHSINDPIGTEEQNDVGDQSSPILKTQNGFLPYYRLILGALKSWRMSPAILYLRNQLRHD